MFTNSRYVTNGIISEIPNDLQSTLWAMIDALKIDKDYLQVFELSHENGKQKIIHSQEQPKYKNEVVIDSPSWEPVTSKIYVIDNSLHSTMFLADEY